MGATLILRSMTALPLSAGFPCISRSLLVAEGDTVESNRYAFTLTGDKGVTGEVAARKRRMAAREPGKPKCPAKSTIEPGYQPAD